VARLGGDEFAVLLPETDHDGAMAAAAKIAHWLEALHPPPPLPADLRLRVSIGLASGSGHIPRLADLLAEADRDMYRQKFPGVA
jgi:diguanylate cyclase (GGDEF)-like protein